MRNLELVTHRIGRFLAGAATSGIEATALNAAARALYIVTQSKLLLTFDLDQYAVTHTVSLAGDDGDETSVAVADTVLSLHYLTDTESLHLVTSSGSIILYSVSTSDITLVGKFDGVQCAAWSPDSELLALVTDSHVLTLMTSDSDILCEAPVLETGEGVVPGQVMPQLSPHRDQSLETRSGASVCWRGDGQYFAVSLYHSTHQYRRVRVYGRHGEQTSQSYPFPAPVNGATDMSLGLSSMLAWRPNGSVIASSHRRAVGDSETHEIVFFERNGLRHGEFTLQQSTTGTTNKIHVLSLGWNVDSDVVAVQVQDSVSGRQSIELYSQSNYKHYHKYSVQPSPPHRHSHSQCHYHWHPESPLTLYVLTGSGEFHSYSFVWDYCVSLTEKRWAAVVDGSSVLVTPLTQAIIPPPMSWATIALSQSQPQRVSVLAMAFPSPPSDLSIAPLVALTSDRRLHFIHDINSLKRSMTSTSLLSLSSSTLNIDDSGFELGSLRLIQARTRYWTSTNADSPTDTERVYDIVAVTANATGDIRDELIELTIVCHTATHTAEIVSMFRTPVPANVNVLRLYHTASGSASDSVYVQMTDSQIYQYNISHTATNESPSLSPLTSLPSPCPWFGVTTINDNTELAVFGRDRQSRLYCNTTLLTPQCSSFSLAHPRYFAFTIVGAQHAVFFLDRTKSLEFSMSVEARSDPHSVRMIEKGAMLVTVIPATLTPRAVLQMPRGNLEAIYPRALTLQSILQALTDRQYGVAFHTARTNRIDLNLLVDHDVKRFIADSAVIVGQLSDVDHINLLLSSIVDRDVIEEEFPNYDRPKSFSAVSETVTDTVTNNENDANNEVARGLAGDKRHRFGLTTADRKSREQAAINYEKQLANKQQLKQSFDSKINAVCHAFRGALNAIDSQRYVLSIITSLVRENPPKLAEALSLIKAMNDTAKSQSTRAVTKLGTRDFSGAEGALKYAIFLCDVNQLYTVALGMYDREIALMVARHAQMDPKEYLPLIDALFAKQHAQPFHTQYTIDTYLRRWDRAAINLIEAVNRSEVDSAQWSDVLKLTKERELWDVMLEYVTPVANDRPVPQSAEPVKQLQSPVFDLSSPLGRYHSLLQAYGHYLRNDRRPIEALTPLLVCGDYRSAVKCYHESGDWRSALALAYQMNLDQDSIRATAYEFVTSLRDSATHSRDAARLLLELGEDVSEAVSILCASEDWHEAHYTSQSQGRPDLYETAIKPALLASVTVTIKQLTKRKEKYSAAVSRLRIVRRVKLMVAPSMIDGGNYPFEDVDDDLLSIVSGVTGRESSSRESVSGESVGGISAMTSASRASTSSVFSLAPSEERRELSADERRLQRVADRQKKKSAKKKVKEGSANEESGLLELLRECRITDSQKDKIGRTIQFVVAQGLVMVASELQSAFQSLLSLQTSEESNAMPLLPNMTPSQRESLERYWDWPGSIQRVESKKKADSASVDVLNRISANVSAAAGVTASVSVREAAGANGVSVCDDEEDSGDAGGLFGAMGM